MLAGFPAVKRVAIEKGHAVVSPPRNAAGKTSNEAKRLRREIETMKPSFQDCGSRTASIVLYLKSREWWLSLDRTGLRLVPRRGITSLAVGETYGKGAQQFGSGPKRPNRSTPDQA